MSLVLLFFSFLCSGARTTGVPAALLRGTGQLPARFTSGSSPGTNYLWFFSFFFSLLSVSAIWYQRLTLRLFSHLQARICRIRSVRDPYPLRRSVLLCAVTCRRWALTLTTTTTPSHGTLVVLLCPISEWCIARAPMRTYPSSRREPSRDAVRSRRAHKHKRSKRP